MQWGEGGVGFIWFLFSGGHRTQAPAGSYFVSGVRISPGAPGPAQSLEVRVSHGADTLSMLLARRLSAELR